MATYHRPAQVDEQECNEREAREAPRQPTEAPAQQELKITQIDLDWACEFSHYGRRIIVWTSEGDVAEAWPTRHGGIMVCQPGGTLDPETPGLKSAVMRIAAPLRAWLHGGPL
jgi:hypothetical protein